MENKSKTGRLGEDLASDFLISKGYKILQRNYRQKYGELDIIAHDKLGTLVFIEVKTMRQKDSAIAELKPEDNLTFSKLKKVQRTAQLFVGKHSELINEDRGWRIDLVAICLTLNKSEIAHYENI